MKTRIAALALVCGVALVACGGGGPAASTVDPLPDLPVATASAGSPLPQVTVRQINGDRGFVQFKNELPADRPLLVWFWAPH